MKGATVAEYRVVWLRIAEDQYLAQLAGTRALVDDRLGALAGDPFAEPGTVYNQQSDQYSVPLGDRGFLFCAVVAEPPVVIVVRLVVL